MNFFIRKASLEDCPAIELLIVLSARTLNVVDYTPEQTEGARQGAYGLDT